MFGGWGASNNNASTSTNTPTNNQPAAGGFGGTGFGQPAQNAGGFGGFGQQPAQNNTTPGGFGGFGGATNAFAAKPANAFGGTGFGASTAPSTSTGFGSTSTTTGFGATPSNTGGFGTGFGSNPGTTTGFSATTNTGGFGAGNAFGTNTGNTGNAGNPTTGAFGGGGFGANSGTNAWAAKTPGQTGQGTANPPFTVETERDPGTANVTLHYQSISCMGAYKTWSPEELRTQDYAVGRKTSASTGATGGFGAFPATQQNTASGFGTFGGATTNNTTGGFGGFGSNANTNASTAGGFGTNGATTTGFGLSQGTSPFGANANTNANANANANTGGAFGFGSQQNNATGTGFGNTPKPFGGFGTGTPTNTTGGFGGGFGATNANAGTNPFGQTAQQNNGFGAFGQANKPAGFGGGTPGFGQSATPNAFGQAPANNAFGNPSQAGTGAFGNNTAGAGTNTGFGTGNAFGQAPAQGGANPFGQTAQPAANPFGGFGQNQGQNAGTGATGFGGLFGNNKPATPGGTTGGFGFGASTLGNPGSNTNNPLGQPSLGLGGTGAFGQNANNATNNLFQQQKPGLFGGPTGANNQATNPFGGFGLGANSGLGGTMNVNPAAANTNVNPFGSFAGFGQTATGAAPQGTTNLFGNSTALVPAQQQQQQQPSLTASVDQPFSASGLPVFELLPGAIGASSLSASALGKKKASNFFMKKKPLPSAKVVASLTSSSSMNPLRGFANSTSGPLSGSVTSTTRPASSAISLMLKGGTTPSTSQALSSSFMTGTLSDKTGLSGELFNNHSGRSSVKKLILDKEVTGDELSSVLAKNAANAKKNTGNALELLRGSPANPAPSTGGNASAAHARGGVAPKPAKASDSAVEDGLEEGDYWIHPSESALVAMPFRELEKIEGFKCGRKGYGFVEFLEPVNLTMVGNIKEVPGKFIIFDERECTVYPDEFDKPPVGQGLNVRAKIRLLRCWAFDKATREPIKDENHPKQIAHLRRLKSIPETTFEGFDLERGEWTFIVNHFSRYGLGDEDDEEEEQEMLAAQAAAAAAPSTQPSGLVVGRLVIPPSSEDEDMEDADAPPRRTSARPRDTSMRPSKEPTPSYRRRGSANPPRIPIDDNDADNDEPIDEDEEESPDQHGQRSWPAQLGMDPQRVGQMQTSLFAPQYIPQSIPMKGKSGRLAIKPPARAPTPSALGKHPRERALLEEAEELGMGLLQRKASVERQSFAEAAKDFESVHDRQLVFVPPARKYLKIAKESIVEGNEHLYRDAGLAFGRSFRVGWGPNGTLVHLGAICGPLDECPPPESFSIVNVTQISTTAFNEAQERQRAEDQLKLYIDHCSMTIENFGIPRMARLDTLNFQPFATSFHQDDTSFEASLWRLTSALFDDIQLDISDDIDQQKMDQICSLRRKVKVSDWLQAAVAPSIEQVMLNGGSTPITKIFALLTGNQIERACQVAMDAGDFHLATLLAQVGGDKRFRNTMWSQWSVWVKEKVDAFIPDDYRRVYAILSGEVTLGVGSNSEDPFLKTGHIEIARGLDWKRAFGLHLWHNCLMEQPVSQAVDFFDEGMAQIASAGASEEEGDALILGNPPPWYMNVDSNSPGPLWDRGSDGDALLHLIRLSVDSEYSLEDTLAPRAYSPHSLDYRLPWQLFSVLATFMKFEKFPKHDKAILGDRLAISYAMQLENQGLLEPAIMVLLHLRNPICRAQVIKDTLMRNADSIDDSSERILSSFNIQKHWIAGAKAAHARYHGMAYDAYQFYLEAGDQKFACDIVIADLAPDAIIRHDLAVLRELFEPFTPEMVDDWSIRGKLFLDYADVMEKIPVLVRGIISQPHSQPNEAQKEEAKHIQETIPRLLQLLPPIFGSRDLSNTRASYLGNLAADGGYIYQDKRHKAALDEMLSGLVLRANSLETVLLDSPKMKLDLRGVEAGARLRAVQAAAYDRFCKSVEVV